ncbi:MAG: hypothetical protein ATN35_13465 [Epulopiscium sp. Nele67-Bin004]|nr:MAG: hypothetical protein ATN35_13465 [Epulopiscium sp. Nele67-Bin004]
MLDNKGFDLWADDYDLTVKHISESNSYPFAGYKSLLSTIYSQVKLVPNASVLDLGIGTGVLSTKLYNEGYTITGVDFSGKMLEICRPKMPNATLIEFDFKENLPNLEDKFDFVICTYAIHHLNNGQKVRFISQLLTLLTPQGKILIGDVAFANKKQEESCREQYLDIWDTDEIYLIATEIVPCFKNSTFKKISFCAGILEIHN